MRRTTAAAALAAATAASAAAAVARATVTAYFLCFSVTSSNVLLSGDGSAGCCLNFTLT